MISDFRFYFRLKMFYISTLLCSFLQIVMKNIEQSICKIHFVILTQLIR